MGLSMLAANSPGKLQDGGCFLEISGGAGSGLDGTSGVRSIRRANTGAVVNWFPSLRGLQMARAIPTFPASLEVARSNSLNSLNNTPSHQHHLAYTLGPVRILTMTLSQAGRSNRTQTTQVKKQAKSHDHRTYNSE